MSKKINPVSAIIAFTVFAITSSAMAQASRTTRPGQQVTSEAITVPGSIPDLSKENRGSRSPKAAVVAVKREGRVQLVGGKEKLIGAMQRALNSGKEPGEVRDIGVLSFEKLNYLAIRIEKQGTLYLQLEPSDGGIQEIFHIGDLNSLYCNGGCSTCNLIPASLSQGTGPECSCAPGNQGLSTDCKLYPRRDVRQLAQQVNAELLAIGFELVDEGSSSSEGHGVIKGATVTNEIKPGRTTPIKRPKN